MNNYLIHLPNLKQCIISHDPSGRLTGIAGPQKELNMSLVNSHAPSPTVHRTLKMLP